MVDYIYRHDDETIYTLLGKSEEDFIEEWVSEAVESGEYYAGDAEELASGMINAVDGYLSDDPSVDFEVVTDPEPFDRAIETLKSGLKYMRDDENIYTTGGSGPHDKGTGLHINVSSTSTRFTKENFDVLKLYLLMQERWFSKTFGERHYVEKIIRKMSNTLAYNEHLLIELAENYKNHDELVSILRDLIPQEEKFISINFGHLAEDKDSRRIEFRFPGGEDYEYKEKEIIDWMYRMAFMTMAAYDEDFGRKEYIREIAKLLDTLTKMNFGGSFDSFAKLTAFIMENGTLPEPDDEPPSGWKRWSIK